MRTASESMFPIPSFYPETRALIKVDVQPTVRFSLRRLLGLRPSGLLRCDDPRPATGTYPSSAGLR
jgi:hypothetical protein